MAFLTKKLEKQRRKKRSDKVTTELSILEEYSNLRTVSVFSLGFVITDCLSRFNKL